MNSPQIYEDRKKLGISEQCICLIELRQYRYSDAPTDLQFVIHVYDPLQGTCETLPRVPHFPCHHHGIPLHCHCVCVKQKLVLIGGWDRDVWGKLFTVFIYDFSSARWSRGAKMPLVTISGACSVSPEGLIYVAGGMEDDETALGEAAVYNVEEDE